MLTSSKSSISHFIMRLVMLSRIVCSSDWYPSSSSSLSSSSSSLSSTLRLAACRMFCSHRRQWTVQLRRWPWGKKTKLWLPTDECTYWQIKPWSTEWIPVAPGGRLGLHALWCMVPVSPGAKGPVQTRSSVSATDTDTDTQTWREADIHINRQVETSTSFTSHRPVRRGFAWWSWQAESCVGEHRRTPETGKSAIPTIKKEKYNKQTNKTQIPHLIKHKADVSLLAQAAAQAAEDLQTKRFIGSRVVTCMNFHLDLCWVISKILNWSKLMTKSNVNWKQKSCYEVTCNFDWLDNAAFNYKHVYCPLASPDSCCFSSLHFCFICTETCRLYS